MKKFALLPLFRNKLAGLLVGLFLAWCFSWCGSLLCYADSYQLGLTFYSQGDYLTASRYFLEAAAQDEENPNAHYYLADSYLKLNRLAEAQAEYQKIMVMAPNSQAARLSRTGLTNLRGYLDSQNHNGWRRTGGSGLGAVKDQYQGELIQGEDYLDAITENGRRVRWALSKMPLKVYIEQTPIGIRNFQPAFVSQVRKGLDVWVGVLGHQLNYVLVNRKEEADIRVSWTNAIDTQGHSGDGGTAYTAGLMIPKLRDDRIEFMDVQIATFDIQGKAQTADIIYAVAIHELGHSLGLLGHSEKPGDIMFARNQQVVQPSKRDMNTLRKLYTLPADINNLDLDSRPTDPNRNKLLAKAAAESLRRLEAQAKKDGMALSYLNLSVSYYQKGKQVQAEGGNAGVWFDKALQAVSQAVKMEPKDPRAYHKRSLVYQELENYNAALQDIQKSITYDRKEPEYLMLQSWYLARLNRLAEARSSLDAYLLARPGEANSQDVIRIREALASKNK
ncbi:matrixin family metalloprotease [Vampirovibrio sp.]|uniref:matrixin family metalloprotease n=1 Tax=Vampirovibrio sp. TaxID=2717857 RepID=UPI0035932CDA